MGILMGIVSFILGLLINLIDAAVMAMLDSIGYDIDTFVEVFPFAGNALDTFVGLGLTVLMVGLLWQVIKGLGAPFGTEYENPLYVAGKVAVTWFAVINLSQILSIFTNIFKIVLDDMQSQPLNPEMGAGFVVESMMSNVVSALLVTATGGLLAIVYIIFTIILGWKFIKLLIEMIERYIVYCFICLVGPTFVATAAFKSTRNISETWFRAFFGQSLLILLNTWSARMFLSYMQLFLLNPAGLSVSLNPLVMLFFGFAFLSFASRIDSFLRILGLNTAHTGSSMGQSVLGGMTKMLMAMRSIQGMGGMVGGAMSAAAGAGGFGTPAGMKAAAGAIFGGMTGGAGNAGGAASTIGGIGGTAAEGTNRRADGTKADPSAPGRRSADVGGAPMGANGRTPTGTPAGSPGAAAQAGNAPMASGSLLKQEPTPGDQIMGGQKEIQSALGHQAPEDSSLGIGGTNGIAGLANKADYVDGGVMSSAGRQGELANQHHGSGKPMGEIMQDNLSANAVRAAATSAERTGSGGLSQPIADYKGQEAAAAMNGVLAFGNDNLKGFSHALESDGLTSGISGMEFQDGSSVTFDSVSGGVASGVYTDAAGNSTAFDMVHDNAIDSMNAAGGIAFDGGAGGPDGGVSGVSDPAGTSGPGGEVSGGIGGPDGISGIDGSVSGTPGMGMPGNAEGAGRIEFDKSNSAGYVGDGSGERGFHIVPKAASPSDGTTTPYGHSSTYEQMGATVDYNNTERLQQAQQHLKQFAGNLNPADKTVATYPKGKLEQMQGGGNGSMPKTRQQKKPGQS